MDVFKGNGVFICTTSAKIEDIVAVRENIENICISNFGTWAATNDEYHMVFSEDMSTRVCIFNLMYTSIVGGV